MDRAGSRIEGLACEEPVVIVEVLSPSTAGLDFTVKLREYEAIASVRTYLICSQDQPRPWFWQRGADGAWPELPVELAGRDGTIALQELGTQISMAEIFLAINLRGWRSSGVDRAQNGNLRSYVALPLRFPLAGFCGAAALRSRFAESRG